MNIFLKHAAQVRKRVSLSTQQSPSCPGMHERIDHLFTLADRLLCSCIGDPAFGDLPRRTEKVLSQIDSGVPQGAPGVDAIKDCCEAFLKALFNRADPVGYQTLQTNNPRGFTLFPVIRELKLLSQQELDLPLADAAGLGDQAKSAALRVRHLRNEVSHSAPAYEVMSEEANLHAALLTMLVALDKHRDQLRTNLRVLIADAFDASEQLNDTLRMVRSERERHLRRFKGRERALAEIRAQLEERAANEGGYILLTAPEGFGKSALAARLSDTLQSPSPSLGSNVSDVVKMCPWLPWVVYHTGKQAISAYHFVETIIRQANCLLVRPVEFDRAQIEERLSLSSTTIGHPSFKDSASTVLSSNEERYKSPSPQVERKSESAEMRLALRAAFHLCLERLVEERGRTIMILDSLDELNLNANDVTLFPQALPRGIATLLISRDVQATAEIRRHLRPVERGLDGLNIEEVRQLTQVNDESWNEAALRSSRGAPLYIATLADAVKKAGGDYQQVDPSSGPSEILDRQVKQWKLPNVDEEQDPLFQTMLLLGVFEPVSSLDVDLIKGFLASCQISISRNQLRDLLREVSSQVDGITEGQVKLAVRAFSSHVCTEICGRKELRSLISRVGRWLASEEDASAELQAAFLKHWTDPKLTTDPAQRENAKQLMRLLDDGKSFERLYDIYLRRPADEDETPDVFLTCLRLAAEGGSRRAASTLGRRLVLASEYGEETAPEGEQWLRKAIAMEDSSAPLMLGIYLLSAPSAETARLAEGERLVREAMEHGNRTAAIVLGGMYLSDGGPAYNPAEGERLLYQAATTGDLDAMLMLGNHLVDGRGLAKDVPRGESLLREAANGGNSEAMLSLGERLLDGDGLARAEGEGAAWLTKAADTGETAAMIELGSHYIDGSGLPKDVERGVNWLRKAIAQGDHSAMLLLGIRYLEGDGLPRAPLEGERLLREAAKKSNPQSMLALAIRLMDGDGVKRSTVEGRQLLFKAAQKKYPPAMQLYGGRLLDGDGFKKETAEGHKWLLRAANAGLSHAMLELGSRLVKGETLAQDKQVGEDWIRKAIRYEDTDAKVALANLLLDGDLPSKDDKEGLLLLEAAAEKGSADAMGELAFRMRIGHGLPVDIAQSDEWLKRAGEQQKATPLIAMTYYMRGRTIGEVSDLEKAANAFRHKAKDDRFAAANLAYMVRRGETGAIQDLPSLDELLEKGCASNDVIALMNEALRRAKGVGCVIDWRRTDELIARLRVKRGSSQLRDALAWWYLMITKFDDGEGHLVVGLLARHGLVNDPQGLSARDRFLRAKERGWDVPVWMENSIK